MGTVLGLFFDRDLTLENGLRSRFSRVNRGPTAERFCGDNSLETVLYTRRNCHLCEDALALLTRYGVMPREVDIDADPTLRERFDTCVPVVEIDGKVRFRGRIDERLLRRLLRGHTD